MANYSMSEALSEAIIKADASRKVDKCVNKYGVDDNRTLREMGGGTKRAAVRAYLGLDASKRDTFFKDELVALCDVLFRDAPDGNTVTMPEMRQAIRQLIGQSHRSDSYALEGDEVEDLMDLLRWGDVNHSYPHNS